MDNLGPAFNSLRSRSAYFLLPLTAMAFASAVASAAHAEPQQGTFVTFDAPGGGGISSMGINPAGVVTGTYVIGTSPNFVFYGFLRAPDGTFTTINVPGSTSTVVGPGSEPFAGPPINPAGAITGSFVASGASHGFVRAPDGTFTTVDAPGAVNGTDFLCCITPAGAVAGISFDANGAGHGFLRDHAGAFTEFDPPGSTLTAPTGINPAGAISGVYFDANGIEHGFLRAGDGTITTFDAPGAINGTQPDGINPAGANRRSLF
jgi:hypothetical protein